MDSILPQQPPARPEFMDSLPHTVWFPIALVSKGLHTASLLKQTMPPTPSARDWQMKGRLYDLMINVGVGIIMTMVFLRIAFVML